MREGSHPLKTTAQGVKEFAAKEKDRWARFKDDLEADKKKLDADAGVQSIPLGEGWKKPSSLIESGSIDQELANAKRKEAAADSTFKADVAALTSLGSEDRKLESRDVPSSFLQTDGNADGNADLDAIEVKLKALQTKLSAEAEKLAKPTSFLETGEGEVAEAKAAQMRAAHTRSLQLKADQDMEDMVEDARRMPSTYETAAYERAMGVATPSSFLQTDPRSELSDIQAKLEQVKEKMSSDMSDLHDLGEDEDLPPTSLLQKKARASRGIASTKATEKSLAEIQAKLANMKIKMKADLTSLTAESEEEDKEDREDALATSFIETSPQALAQADSRAGAYAHAQLSGVQEELARMNQKMQADYKGVVDVSERENESDDVLLTQLRSSMPSSFIQTKYSDDPKRAKHEQDLQAQIDQLDQKTKDDLHSLAAANGASSLAEIASLSSAAIKMKYGVEIPAPLRNIVNKLREQQELFKRTDARYRADTAAMRIPDNSNVALPLPGVEASLLQKKDEPTPDAQVDAVDPEAPAEEPPPVDSVEDSAEAKIKAALEEFQGAEKGLEKVDFEKDAEKMKNSVDRIVATSERPDESE